MKNKFGKLILRKRTALGLSLRELADAAKLTKNHVWDMERGRSVNPTIETLCGLAEALKVNAEDLCFASILDHGSPISIAACDRLAEDRQ